MLAVMLPMAHASLDVSELCRYKRLLNHTQNAIIDKHSDNFSSFVFCLLGI